MATASPRTAMCAAFFAFQANCASMYGAYLHVRKQFNNEESRKMKAGGDESLTLAAKTDRSYEVNEQHVFDECATEERALCGDASSADGRISVDCYMGRRKDGLEVGTVCEGCKAFVPPFARRLSRDLEADGRLADTLLRETEGRGL